MRLIGMLDSPYVRRVAVSLQLLGLRFEHESLSVFRAFDQISRINPVVKVPTLVCDDGVVLMDSTLILDYAESLAGSGRSLMPTTAAERQASLRVIGLALAACEKAVQIIYERNTRPLDKQHAPWMQRVTTQLLAALTELEAELLRRPLAASSAHIKQAGVTTAVTWRFVMSLSPPVLDPAQFPALQAFSAQAELLPEFSAAPHGESVYRPVD